MADQLTTVTFPPQPQSLIVPPVRNPVAAQLLDWSGVPISGANPLPITGSFSIGANASVNLNQVAGSAVNTGHGTAAGSIRVELPTDGTGIVGVASSGFSQAVSFTRPNDTNPYLANDVLGSATGSTAALTFAIAPSAGGEIMITSAALETDAAAVISGEAGYVLYLYNVTPPSAYGDNAAWDLGSGDRASFLGFVNLGQPVDLGSTCYVETNGINKQIKAASGNIFAYLVTLGAFTPVANTIRVITLHTIAL